jgi:hypothetical protein
MTLSVVGRIRKGVTREQAQQDLDRIAKRLQDTYPATNEP